MTNSTRNALRRELGAMMAQIAQQTPMKPKAALRAGYAAWCVLYERDAQLARGEA